MVSTTSTTLARTGTRNPVRTWLKVLGFVLVAIAILGMVDAAVNMFHGMDSHIEGGEMVLHWILAIVTLGMAYGLKDDTKLANAAIAYGVVYILLGVAGFFMPNDGAEAYFHVGMTDHILHLALGIITVAAAMASRRPSLATKGYETETQTERAGLSRRR